MFKTVQKRQKRKTTKKEEKKYKKRNEYSQLDLKIEKIRRRNSRGAIESGNTHPKKASKITTNDWHTAD